MSTNTINAESIDVAATCESRDPVAIFFGDPHSHLSDVLYLYFRHYKRQLIYRFFTQAIDDMGIEPSDTLAIADVGASMGFDLKYVFSRLTVSRQSAKAIVSLIEGDDNLIRGGEVEWSDFGKDSGLTHRYLKSDLAKSVPLPDSSQDIILCSEVVEHLEDPRRLLREICRVLKPNGRF